MSARPAPRACRDGQALRRHALRNALIPVLTIMGLQFSFLLAGDHHHRERLLPARPRPAGVPGDQPARPRRREERRDAARRQRHRGQLRWSTSPMRVVDPRLRRRAMSAAAASQASSAASPRRALRHPSFVVGAVIIARGRAGRAGLARLDAYDPTASTCPTSCRPPSARALVRHRPVRPRHRCR